MVYYAAAALLGLAASATATAGKLHAHQHLHKRGHEYGAPASKSVDACTAYTTTWYGKPTLVPYNPPAATSTECTTSSAAAATSYAAPASSSAPASPAGYSKSSNNGAISANGNQWAMTYTPYAQDGTCKDAGSVMSDIQSIKAKGFTTVRLYATDCSAPQNVGAACRASGMKVIMGIYIDGSGLSGAYSQLSTIAAWGNGNWDMVEMVVAGNEAIFNGFVSAPDLAGFLAACKSQLSGAGYNGPVTTTEPLNIIQENAGTLCAAVDVIAANLHPYFNGGVAASQAGTFVASQLELLAAACGGAKPAYNLETGWPSAGLSNGAAIAGTYEQQQAIDSILAAVGSKSAIFSFEDDTWKAPGALGIEQYWGCSGLFSG